LETGELGFLLVNKQEGGMIVNTEEVAFVLVSVNVLTKMRVRVRAMKGYQAKTAPTRPAKSPAERKLTGFLGVPFLLLPEEVPGEVVGEGVEVVDEEELVLGVGNFVVLVVVVVGVVVVVVVVDVLEELPLVRVVESGRLTEVVEFRQVVARGRWV
jgi:hypothetical protein